jgi:hypothetical protein
VAIQRGFALVGVVMFILVLTILGLSLFSLSGFEAQFMQRSQERSQCFFAAMGGIERAKWVLTGTSQLENVTLNLPRDSVVYAEARQGATDWESANSSGPVVWDGDPVWIRVRAAVGAASRLFEARFQPTTSKDVYRRLMALSALHDSALVVTVRYPDENPRWTQTDLIGEVWQNSTFTHRADSIATLPVSPSFRLTGGIPDPDLDSYFAPVYADIIDTQPIPNPGSSTSTVVLDGSSWPNGIGLFRKFGTASEAIHNWSVYWTAPTPTIQVKGTAIWMTNRGFYVQERLRVQGITGADFLVLVGQPYRGDDGKGRSKSVPHWDAGIALAGSLEADVPVILVSDGRVEVIHKYNPDQSSTAPYLSIFATHALITGPQAPMLNPPVLTLPPRLRLAHPVSGLPPEFDAILDKLYELRLLPNTDAALGNLLVPLAGTWHEMTSYAAPN